MKRLILSVLLGAVLVNPGECRPEQPSAWTQSLHAALTGISKLRVRSGGTCHRRVPAEKTLLELQDAAAIASLVHQITIEDRKSGFHCMCCGNPTLEFYRDGELVASLGFHHGESLRWPGGKWKGDGQLTAKSAEFLDQWLAARGITAPKREYDFTKARRKKNYQELQQKWVQAMPASLKTYWPRMEDYDPFEPPLDLRGMYYDLALEYPAQGERIRALLSWYGAGEGPWSGFPPYEDVAERLLLRFETKTILAAIQGRELNPRQTEGAARLFGGWAFSQQHPQDLRLLPAELKERLLEHSLQSQDRDKRARAQKAFGEQTDSTTSAPGPAAGAPAAGQ